MRVLVGYAALSMCGSIVATYIHVYHISVSLTHATLQNQKCEGHL